MWVPFWTLFKKEVIRFLKVWMHTVLAPVLTGGLYLFVFGEALSKHLPVYEGVSYTAFIIPGLIMMTVLQNTFPITASSLIQFEDFRESCRLYSFLPAIPGTCQGSRCLYSAASVRVAQRSLAPGSDLLCSWWASPPVREPGLLIAFGFFGAAIMAALGLITALWAEKYDQMGAVMNFVIMPLTFLSGVFYSVDSLPPFWQAASRLNPFYYLVDGFRQGFSGAATPTRR